MAVDARILEPLVGMSDLTPDELARVAALANSLSVIEGELLARKGAPAQTCFINISGHFMVVFEEERALTLHTPGGILGVSSALSPFLHRGTTTALTDGEVVAIPGQDLMTIIQEGTPLGNKLISKIDSIIAERRALLSEA